MSQRPDAIIRIDAAVGEDPLVASYVAHHKADCAYQVLSWPWLIIGFLAAIAGGLIGDRLAGAPAPLDVLAADQVWIVFAHLCLGNPVAVLWGMLGGAVTASVLGSVVRSGGIPASHEPLIGAPGAVLLYIVSYDWLLAVSAITGLVCLIYLGVTAYRLMALLLGGAKGLHQEVPAEPADGWPVYTVLVPLYRETAVADKILRHLGDLDYPKDKLDVKFLLEADDPDTLAALEQAGLPEWAEIVVVPDAQPKTKPRACNHGLERARGEYLVIFDAEDRPQSDQLKQAVAGFAQVSDRHACLQAQLAYHNHDQNLLTRWFALEYNVWFRRYLRGLVRLGAPIPLGGTSNHFRTAVLRQFQGWDPFNVTEDCDLGIRLHMHGYRTAIVESVTWEEANSRLGNWIRQRSRWLKGYLVTHMVWWRRPVRLMVKLKPWGFVGFFSAVFGVAGLAVLNLPLWIALGVYVSMIGYDMSQGHELWDLLSQRRLDGERLSWPMVFWGETEDPTWSRLSIAFFAASMTLLAANVFFILVNALFGRRPGQKGLIFAALLSPLYWVIMSIAAWKGLWQMLLRPHYWEKTVHGLSDEHDADKASGP
ncbi:MAG: glycosyltransferase [Planctomycetota bacterium]|jgi:cellulose synthase/poly-beta-1,6-N-acetylglucosamine synthase-like glycosyltransferase|nr:glycosyltransferase [Planctomycetota bacterium]